MILPLEEIAKQYPEHLRAFPAFLLREYLQVQILRIIFSGPHAGALCFLGGTCLRIIHESQRFSEDLDFDHKGLSTAGFDQVAADVRRGLELLGLDVELENVYRGAYHCYIKFPGLLHRSGLSGHSRQKLLIQLDTEDQGYAYPPDLRFINRFDVFFSLPTTPMTVLLAQKFHAVFNRRQPKGRDFYDISFLMGRGIRPDYRYLELKMGIPDPEHLREKILDHCQSLDLRHLAEDVRPFLFDPADVRRILQFPEFIAGAQL